MLDLISAQSFTSLWYWIFVAVYWSRVMQAPLGVPGDLLRRARRDDAGAARDDALALARLHAKRWRAASAAAGAWRAAAWGFVVSALCVLGLGYSIELGQAFLLLVLPSALVSYLSGRTAGQVVQSTASDQTAIGMLLRLRARVQWIGTLSVFATALWGSYANLMRYAF